MGDDGRAKNSPSRAQILPLRRDEHEDAARVAIQWLDDRHRKGWRIAFEALLERLRPEQPGNAWRLDDDVMEILMINAQ